MNKIRNNVYVYLGFLVAFCAVILFGIFLGPQYPSVFFWGIIVLALGSICLYFSPSLRDQENVRKAIVEKVPEEFGITGRLWTLGRTREYIRKEFHKTISERTLSDYMKRWGMSCQRPVKRARRQNPQGI